MSRGWAKASAYHLQITLSCAVLCHIVSLQYLSRSFLHRLAGLPCRLFLSYGLQVVTREVHRSSLRQLICPAQDHFIFLSVDYIYESMTFVLSLTQMLVFLSLYVMLSIFLSIWSVRPQVCSVLVWGSSYGIQCSATNRLNYTGTSNVSFISLFPQAAAPVNISSVLRYVIVMTRVVTGS